MAVLWQLTYAAGRGDRTPNPGRMVCEKCKLRGSFCGRWGLEEPDEILLGFRPLFPYWSVRKTFVFLPCLKPLLACPGTVEAYALCSECFQFCTSTFVSFVILAPFLELFNYNFLIGSRRLKVDIQNLSGSILELPDVTSVNSRLSVTFFFLIF